MIERLQTQQVGPAESFDVTWAPRLNVIAGDNGLGKSFLLDLCWWALTRTWATHAIIPSLGAQEPGISYEVVGSGRSVRVDSRFNRSNFSWTLPVGRPPKPGICVYAKVDGGFATWDSARNYWRNDFGRPDSYQFEPLEIWNGLDLDGLTVCEGLERDWVTWQKGQEPQFEALKKALKELSPPTEQLIPGPPMRVNLAEGRDRPTIIIGGEPIPLAFASAGIKRIIALAYLLTWTMHEHKAASELLRKEPANSIVLIIDEPEAHLHPKWQRTIIPSLMNAVSGGDGLEPASLQLISATHSPLVLASLEPFFDSETDDLMALDRETNEVVLKQHQWAKNGDVINWLVSDVFGLEQARSLQAERAIEAAEALMRDEAPAGSSSLSHAEVELELRRLLPAHDPFWARWLLKGAER